MTSPSPSSTAPRAVRIGMVAHNSYAAVFPRGGRVVGGIETWAWTLARELARAGHHPTLYLRHTAPLPAAIKDGVQLRARIDRFRDLQRYVAECVQPSSHFPGFHITRWRAGLGWRVPLLLLRRPFRRPLLTPMQPDPQLAALDVDGYVAFGVGPDASTVIATAEARGKPSILLLVSNADIAHEFATQDDFQDRYGVTSQIARYMLSKSTRIICQSRWQQDQLQARFSRQADYLPPPVDLSAANRPIADRRYVLWVGRADRFHKRPLWGAEVARAAPEIPFVMVVNPGDPSVMDELQATLPPNVTLRDYVPFDQIPELFAGALAFISTGSAAFEGFPLVLLHAAAAGTPIVSMHDFDGFLAASHAGWVTGEDPEVLAERLRQLVTGASVPDVAEIRMYLKNHHDLAGYARCLADWVLAAGR